MVHDQHAARPKTGSISVDTMVGRYRIDKLLGSGGMGLVYLATDTRLNRQVAIKIPRPEMVREIEARFEREARTMAVISHPNLAKIIDIDSFQDQSILIMEYVEGENLGDKIRHGIRFDNRTVARILQKLASATACAHAEGVIHRDIKPGNVIVRPDGEPVLMDFGLAYVESDDARMTRAGTILGTPAYMSPEQLLTTEHQVGQHSDIYSLGAICYELLTGRTIYLGTASEVLSLLSSNQPIIEPHRLTPNVDPLLEAICLKSIQRDPSHRFESAQQLSEALSFYLAGDVQRLQPLLKLSLRGSHRQRIWKWVAAAFIAFAFFSGLFIIQTSEGEFVLNTDDPDIATRLSDAGGIVVENRLTKAAYTLNRGANKLPNGDYDLVVTSPDGLEVSTHKFQLRRLGGKVVASVIARPLRDPQPSMVETKSIRTAIDILPTLRSQLPSDLLSHPLISPDWKWGEPENLGRAIFPDGPMNENYISEDELSLIFRSGMSTLIATRENREQPFSVSSLVTKDTYLFFPRLSKDGLRIVACGPRDHSKGGFDLWQWARPNLTDPWKPSPWEFDYLNSEENDGQEWISSDGLEIYFCSSRSLKFSSDDLYVAKRTNLKEPFETPVRLNESMNSPAQDFSPCLAAGDRIMLFNSDRGNGFGKMDIYMSVRSTRDEMFTVPILLDPEVNSPHSEGRPILSADGTLLYFDSIRPGGNRTSDLWCIRRVKKE